MIVLGNVVLIGLREWESVQKNCDLIYVYESGEITKIHDPAIEYFNKYLYDTNICDKYAASANFSFEEDRDDVGGGGDVIVGGVQENIDFDDI